MLVLPTGGGKTITFVAMAKAAADKGKRVLLLVHRSELMEQASIKMNQCGLSHDLIKPGSYGENSQVAIASVQTLYNRLKNGSLNFDLIIIDECHLYMAKSFLAVLSQFPKAFLLAVTATPSRLDGQGLGVSSGGFCDDLVLGPSTEWLISKGYLVQPRVYVPPIQLDLEGVSVSNGDYVTSQLEERVNKPSITGDAVKHYAHLANGQRAIAFCTSIKHAEAVAEEFRSAGISSEVVHGGLDAKTRAERLESLKRGKIKVLTSVDLITTGTDIPEATVAILLRPTKSQVVHFQSIGRVLRPAPNKTHALILDHVGSAFKFGIIPDANTWTLDGKPKRRTPGDNGTTIKQCKNCFAVWESGDLCPYCGHKNPQKPRLIEQVEGQLRELEAHELKLAREERAKTTANKMTEYRNAKTWDEVLAIAKRYGDHAFFVQKRWGFKKNKMKGER